MNTTWEEAVYVRFFGVAPSEKELVLIHEQMASLSHTPNPVLLLIQHAPTTAHPSDLLQAALALLPLYEKGEGDAFTRYIRHHAKIGSILCAIYRARKGSPLFSAHPKYSFAKNLLYRMNGNIPSDKEVDALNRALIVALDKEKEDGKRNW